MKRWIRRIGIGLGVVMGIVVVGLGVLYAQSTLRLQREYPLDVAAIRVEATAEAIARGEHLAHAISLCVDCHGGDLGGKVMLDDPAVGRLVAPNLTPAGPVASYTDADWVRAIRHGVGPDGRPLIVMPADLYTNLSDADLAAMIAYLKHLPPVTRDLARLRVGPLARFGLITNKMPMLPAENIDHAAAHTTPEPGVTPEYGRYLASISCVGCHGPQMQGKSDAFHDVPDVTPQGGLAGWTQEQFVTAMRTGRRPDGSTMAPEKMPWPLIAGMTDLELAALWAYLEQLDRRVALRDLGT